MPHNFVWGRRSLVWKHTATAMVGLLLAVWLSGCHPPTASNLTQHTGTSRDRHDQKVILTTFTVLADMAQNVVGKRAIVTSITKPGAEIHGYEPTPSDLERGQKADLVLDNGLELERWAARFYNSLPQVAHITLSDGVQPVTISEDAYVGKPNPHAWMSPRNALIYVENIRKALVQLDPANAASYHTNAAAYSKQIRVIDNQLQQAIAAIPPDKRYLVSCEGAFSYLARDYGLKEVYIWAVNAERQATPQQVKRVIQTVKANQIPAVFCESTVSNEAQLQVAKEAGATFGGVLYVDSLSPSDGPASTYLKLLAHNVSTLVNGLKGKSAIQ